MSMVMKPIVQLDEDAVRSLRSLVQSTVICLQRLQADMEKDLQLVGYSKSLAEQASDLLAKIAKTDVAEE
jgi:hypothetical protein